MTRRQLRSNSSTVLVSVFFATREWPRRKISNWAYSSSWLLSLFGSKRKPSLSASAASSSRRFFSCRWPK